MLKDATETELTVARNAIQWVWQQWQRIPNIWPCRFDGTRDDLSALDYSTYEGLETYFKLEARIGYTRFAMVFANVLVRTLGFRWVVEDHQNPDRLLLRHDRMREAFDPVQLIRDESEKIDWRCPDFGSLFERFKNGLS